MAPTRPRDKGSNAKARRKRAAEQARRAKEQPTAANPQKLLAEATHKLEQGDAQGAASLAHAAVRQIDENNGSASLAVAALTLLGEIQVELGEMDAARTSFERAVAREDEEAGAESTEEPQLPSDAGGAEDKFLWLAQLSETGGADSVRWFERGAAVLRAQIQRLVDTQPAPPQQRQQQQQQKPKSEAATALADRRRKLAETLCAVAEVYMTDLSWEADAETRCEALVTEAAAVDAEGAGAWRTLASVRISQGRTAEARAALKRALALSSSGSDGEAPAAAADAEDPRGPDFAARVSLVRLLLEVEMEAEAVEVVERLVRDDDRSVEAWYLGGYAHFLLGQRLKAGKDAGGSSTNGASKKGSVDAEAESWAAQWRSARTWLAQCLLLFQAQEYEDERLGEHARELLETVVKAVGDATADGEEDEWEDAGDDDDEEEDDNDEEDEDEDDDDDDDDEDEEMG